MRLDQKLEGHYLMRDDLDYKAILTDVAEYLREVYPNDNYGCPIVLESIDIRQLVEGDDAVGLAAMVVVTDIS